MTIKVPDNHLYIGDTYFKLRNVMKVTSITVPPNPIVFGDTGRASETQAMIQLVQSSYTGGSGRYQGNVRTDAERFWTSTWFTAAREQLGFPPEVVNLGTPPNAEGDLTACISYHNMQFFTFADRIYSLIDIDGTWVEEKVCADQIVDMAVYKEVLYVSYGAGIAQLEAGVWSDVVQNAGFFTNWNDNLYTIANVAGIWTTYRKVTGGGAWSAALATFESDLVPYQLIPYRDAGGDSALYVLTNKGPWIWDNTNEVWRPTDVVLPDLAAGQVSRGTLFRDGKMYFNTGGLSVTNIQNGNPMVVGVMGLDRDDGVPTDEQGEIVGMAADLNWVFAMVGVQDELSSNLMGPAGQSPPLGAPPWSYYQGPATLRAWNAGWHTFYKSPTATSVARAMSVSPSYAKRRLYFGVGGEVFYMDLFPGIFNPRLTPTFRTQPGPVEHITAWWDYGSYVQRKIHGHLFFETEGCDEDNYVDLYYGKDRVDDVWYYIGRITTNGLSELRPGDFEGVPGRFFRFKFLGVRGDDPLVSPRIIFYDSEILRILPASYAFGFEVEISGDVKGKTPAQQLAALKRLLDPEQTPEFYPFAYTDGIDGEPNTSYGRISRINGQEATIAQIRGQGVYMLGFTAPYSQDMD